MTPASSREFGTVGEITLKKKEFGTMPKETMDEQIARVERENRAKDAGPRETTSEEFLRRSKAAKMPRVFKCPFCSYVGTGGRDIGFHKIREHPGQVTPPKAKTTRKVGVKKPKVQKPIKRELEVFKKKLSDAREIGKARKKKAPSARKGIKRMTKHRGTPWSEMTAAQKKRHTKYQKEWRKAKREKAAAAALGVPPSNGHEKGTLPPYPFRFCPDCSKAMPTVERNGKTFPAAKPFCGDCGYKIPLMKG